MIRKFLYSIKEWPTALKSMLAGSNDHSRLNSLSFDEQQQIEQMLEEHGQFVRAHALEQAAIVVDQWNVYNTPEFEQLARRIRSMK